MTTLKVGVASYEEMKARTMAVARGERRVSPNEPKVWFTSTESFAKVLSAGNRELLRVVSERAPRLLDDLARITGRLSLIFSARCERWSATVSFASNVASAVASRRGCWLHDRVELDLPLRLSRKAG